MQKTIQLLGAAGIAVLMVACKGDSKFEGYNTSESGLYYKFFKQSEGGTKPAEGDVLEMSYQFKLQKNDSLIMDSKNYSRQGNNVSEVAVMKPSFKGSFEEALAMMSPGDSASFIAPADSFFLKTLRYNELPPFVKQGDYIRGTFAVKKIKTKAEFEAQQKEMAEKQKAAMKEKEEAEKGVLEKYLADNKITTKPTASGLIYIETVKGKGGSPKPTDMVKVHYTGTLLDGTKFDSSVDRGQPAEFPLNGVIPGWTEALQLMKKGGKAKLIIPSNIAYGGNSQGPIPPFSTLVFEVELIDFKTAPQQPEMVQPAGK